MIRKACLAEDIRQNTLVLHADNGGPRKGATILASLQNPGIMPSFSRPSVSMTSPTPRAVFRTLKYLPSYPARPFDALKQPDSGFMNMLPGTTVSTATVRSALRPRTSVIEAKIVSYPSIVSKCIKQQRNWNLITEVWLNPPKEHQVEKERKPKAA